MKKKEKKQNEQMVMQGVPREKKEQILLEEKKVETQEELLKVSEGQLSIFDGNMGETMIDESVARERLKEAIETEKPKKKKKSLIKNLIFLAINVCVLFYIINLCLEDVKGTSITDIIKTQGSQLWWLVGGFGLFCLMFFADTMIFYSLIKKSTGKRRFGLAYKVSAVGKYFDAITPFSFGGQPSQIMNLTRAGLSPGIATSIPIIKLIIYNIIYTLIILTFLIFGIPFLPVGTGLNNFLLVFLKIFAYIGVIVTALISIVFVLIGSGKIIGRSVVGWFVRLGYKLHIVKDFRKSYNKVMNQVLEYQSSIQYLRKNKKTLVLCILFGIIEALSYFTIPFMVVMAFTSTPITNFASGMSLLFVCIVKAMICQMASVIIPLPGGTGMMEISFAVLFGVKSLLGDYFALGLLIWRFFNYYLTIIQGFTVSTIDSVCRMVKSKKESKTRLEEKVNEEKPRELPSGDNT